MFLKLSMKIYNFLKKYFFLIMIIFILLFGIFLIGYLLFIVGLKVSYLFFQVNNFLKVILDFKETLKFNKFNCPQKDDDFQEFQKLFKDASFQTLIAIMFTVYGVWAFSKFFFNYWYAEELKFFVEFLGFKENFKNSQEKLDDLALMLKFEEFQKFKNEEFQEFLKKKKELNINPSDKNE